MPDHFFVYPTYLNRGTTRALGRRVPQATAVADATVEEIVDVAKSLGFTAEVEPDKQYPRQFFEQPGRVRVAKKAGTSKTEFLRKLSTELARRRAAGASA
jgi:signal recognition particle subunit SRP19